MENGYHDVVRDYIIYRDQHKHLREGSPRSLKVLRRDGLTYVRFNPMKITSALERAFRDTLRLSGFTPPEVVDSINNITDLVIKESLKATAEGQFLTIEFIQDEIEKQLMKEGHYAVAKDFILYRMARAAHRAEERHEIEEILEPSDTSQTFTVLRKDGSHYKLTKSHIRKKISHAVKGHEAHAAVDPLVEETITNFYEGIKEHEVDLAMILAARSKIEMEPEYTYIASNLLLDTLYRETMGIEAHHAKLKSRHREYFISYLKHGVSLGRLDPALLSFNLEKLADALELKRDLTFSYLGLQTLYDRYFIHEEGRRLETPQIFWMRVAMGVALNEKEQKEDRAIEFYNVLSKFLYLSGTPTLFNSGTTHPQLSSCYLSTVMDDLHHIFKIVADDAQLSKWAGGLGNDWTNVRATGALIKGTNGRSQGVIPFLKVANDTAVAVNQCFAPDTAIYTSEGVKAISDIEIGELVLGLSGTYRQVTQKFSYNQKDPMVAISVQHALEPLNVTTAHPFYALRNVPADQDPSVTLQKLQQGLLKFEWVEAAQLKEDDYLAQIVPSEIVTAKEIQHDDLRLYGMLLTQGYVCENGEKWTLNLCCPKQQEFALNYLNQKGLQVVQTHQNMMMQLSWSSVIDTCCEGTTGTQVAMTQQMTFPFTREDLYDVQGNKRIAPRLSHLPSPQTLALLKGMLETSSVSQEEISFQSESRNLAEGLRYQLLRMSIPTAGQRVEATYHVHVPACQEICSLLDRSATVPSTWLRYNHFVFTRVIKTEPTDITPFVFDLEVEADESYMTTSGLAHNGGKRKGAMCAYLETWHLDIEEFLELRKNTGDERRRTHDMNTANWIPDLFMKRVLENGSWTLFSPNEVPDLHDLYGQAFEKRYLSYEQMAKEGKMRQSKQIDAVQLWRKMLGMLFETGHPWITFKDPSNIRSPQDHVGVVHSSNLCTEILLNTSIEETAVCNIGSLNLAAHVTSEGLDQKLLAQTIRTAIRMLDNVIDVNFYPIEEARRANSRHRPIGLGLMGFQDALYMLNISYASHDAIEFADRSMELISYHAILASSELAKERGRYSSYKGSKWDRGLLPIDTVALLAKERGAEWMHMDAQTTLDWSVVRESVRKHGMRNSNTMAIAPTATIANISGVTQSIEPMYKHLFVKSNLSGEFTVLNPFLVQKLKDHGLWNSDMLDDLKYFDGSLTEIPTIPDEVKDLFLTAFEIDPIWIIECAARRQKWIDMGQSLNLYMAETNGKKLHDMYVTAWKKGLKTTYYLRALGATHIEKSTTDINKRGLQPRWMKNESASSRVKVQRGACSLTEGCESCQ
ncbi:MAG: ribonucleoside-diphosphate reductase subunit alpha [Verrucomicrobia bacterium]|nr:ribonucleoside-diphosphate reductase subunit alpha [Verrucomicrobiota bacterium]MBS0647507.1 ribonucleoside-diphosphate reductase subunit alpha [Verrucomicrobiota bacterium]